MFSGKAFSFFGFKHARVHPGLGNPELGAGRRLWGEVLPAGVIHTWHLGHGDIAPKPCPRCVHQPLHVTFQPLMLSFPGKLLRLQKSFITSLRFDWHDFPW